MKRFNRSLKVRFTKDKLYMYVARIHVIQLGVFSIYIDLVCGGKIPSKLAHKHP